MKFLHDGVFKYGDNPTDVLDKYIRNKPVNRIDLNQHRVLFIYDGDLLATVYNPEDYPLEYNDEHSVIYYKPDDRVFLSTHLITPDLIGREIRTENSGAIKIVSFEVGFDFVTFKHDNRITTVPFEGLSYWWIVESTS